MTTRQCVREDVAGARDELRSQTDGERLRPTEYPLSDGVEKGKPGAPFLAKIRHGRDVVTKNCNRLAQKRRLEVEENPTDGKELPGVDRAEPPTRPRGRKRQDGLDAPPNRRPRRLTRSRGRETPDEETPPETDGASEATTADPEGSPETKGQGSTGPPDSKTGEGKSGGTACVVSHLGRGERGRKPSSAERVKHWREARRRTEILQRLTEAWRRDLATEKPQKTGY